ncbi:MAG: EAL domain-containing protein, partial [Actinomycetota bacterium]|nr:EAL domain-containing protein [Actinomycetota bacterium]
WDDEGIHLTVAVNLSVRNFTDAELPIWVEQCLDRTEIEPSRLMLEITESEIMDDVVLALGVLERLSALGVRSSIDDFGTGYSSLSYLRQLPIDEIKIDRSFVGTMAVNQSDTVIVRSIIELGHNLDLDVVAEGVEDEWTLDSLRSLGCDQAQGFYFSRPVPPEQIAEFVASFSESAARL